MLPIQRLRRIAIVVAAAIATSLAVIPASPAAADPGDFTIRSSMNHLCLEIGNPYVDGHRAQMNHCFNGRNQLWRQEGDRFINRASGKCLEILNIDYNPGSYAGVWGCWQPGQNQRWFWDAYLPAGGREIRSSMNHMCLEIRDSWPHPGAYVGMWHCFGGANQSWYTVPA